MSTDDLLLSFLVSSMSRGTVFFAEDLEDSGIDPDQIRFALARLVQRDVGLVRLGRGIYCLARQAQPSGRIVFPSVEEVAGSLARRWRVRIAPCGAQAAYLTGLSGMNILEYTFVSDGSDQVFRLNNGTTITFTKRKSQKIFSYSSSQMRNLVEALRFLGEKNIHTEELAKVSGILRQVSDEDFVHDIRLAPFWIRVLLREYR